MEAERQERRRDPRFPIVASASIKVKKNGKSAFASTVDVSESGVLLRFDEPPQLGVGDQVICEFKVQNDPDNLLPYWVVGTVVRIEGCCAGVDLSNSGFSNGS